LFKEIMGKRIFQSGGGGKRGYAGFPVSQFIALSDAPHTYAGAGTMFVTVKAGENGLEFTPLPPLAITDTFIVNSQAAMLALVAQRGDVAIRTDINQSFILAADDPAVLANWAMLLVSPTHAIGGALHTADSMANLKSKISAPDILITSQAAEISTLTAKATPTANDLLIIEDAADTNKKKKVTIATLPAAAPAAHAFGGALHTADTMANLKSKISAPDILITSQAAEISTLASKATPAAADLFIIEDSADTNKKKSVTLSALPILLKVAKIAITHTQFQTAALTNTITLTTLPAGAIVIGTRLKVSTIFTGGTIANYFLSIGLIGTEQDLMTEYDSKNITVAADEYAEGSCFQSFNYSATVDLKVTARSVTANLSASTQGAADVEIFYIAKS
jgi:hypothetical protein